VFSCSSVKIRKTPTTNSGIFGWHFGQMLNKPPLCMRVQRLTLTLTLFDHSAKKYWNFREQ